MNTCYVYIRVSTEDQKNRGYSPDNQIRQARDYASMHGYQIKKVFDDSGRSGRSTEHRYELLELIKATEESPVDAIIIYKIDRFARNVGDFSRMYNDLKAKGIKLLSINEGDLMEGGNSLIPNIFASVAQWESEVNSSRTKDALAQKFEEGWQPNRPPLGYRSVGGVDEKKTCEPDPYEAQIIKELFELYATGNYSILAIQDWLADQNMISKNGTVLGHSVINTILNNPFYYGWIRWHGKGKMGNHVPIISKNLYDTCQYVLAKHRNFLIRKRTHDFLLRGFVICAECKQRYTAEWHKAERFTKRNGKIAYYHCPKRDRNNCPSPYVEMEDLEKLAADQFKGMQFSQKFIDMVVMKARAKVEYNRNAASSKRQAILNLRTSLETRRNKLEDALLDGTIDRETYKRKHDELQLKIQASDAQLQELEASCNLDMDLIEEVLAFSRNIYQTFVDAPPFLKRHYMRFFYERFEVKNRKIINAIPTPIFLVLQANHAVILTKPELAKWDDFRQTNWVDEIEYPDLTLQQTQQLLAIT